MSFCCKSNSAVAVKDAPPPSSARTSEASEVLANPSADVVVDGNTYSKDSNNIENKAEYGSFFMSNDGTHAQEMTKSRTNTTAASAKSTGTMNSMKSRQSSKVSQASANVSSQHKMIATTASSDDSTACVTTLYEEPPKLPEGAFVLLPDASQRGYEPGGVVSYGSKDDWNQQSPYRIESLVWYRARHLKYKFKWYIPGTIEGHVFGDNNEVIGYKIAITDSAKKDMEESTLAELQNAEPVNVMRRWNETTPPCPIDGIDVDTSEAKTKERILKLVEEYGDDLGFQGAKQNEVGPHMWGITLEQLRTVTEDPAYEESMSMYDVVNKVIKPKTEGTGMGYALHLNQDEPLRAKVMISHAWGENYSQFLQALEQSQKEGPYWVCSMSIAQNNDAEDVTIEKQLGPDPAFGPFATVLKQADSMVAIMTKSCDIYTRLWCVYEIFVAISLNVPVSLQSYNEITTSGGGSDAMYSNVVLDSTGKAVVTSDAECGYDGDKEMIQSEIFKQDGGFASIDDVVMWVRIKSLIDDMPNCVRKSSKETQVEVPIGTCTASNIVSRQNAGIAAALDVWEQAKRDRQVLKVETNGSNFFNTFTRSFTSSGRGSKDIAQSGTEGTVSFDEEELKEGSVYGYICTEMDKMCGHYF